MKNKRPAVVIFSDLDGTLLNEKYDYAAVQNLIDKLLARHVALVLSSSKTYAEIEHYRNKLNIQDPFICENGAAIFVPKGYFNNSQFNRQTDAYEVTELGVPYAKLREQLSKIRAKTGAKIVGFGDLSVNEVAAQCGLTVEMAALAKQRGYDEPFQILEGNEKEVVELLQHEGLTVTKGDRYYHLTGPNNKGIATSALKKLYEENFGVICTFAVGNGPNDVEMLKAVDKPVFVKQDDDLAQIWQRILAEVAQLSSDTDNP